MRSTFKVLFYLKKNTLKPDGKAPIMGRITVNSSIAQFSCKLNIKPDLWDTKANKAYGKSVEAQKINQKLDNIRTQIGKQYQSICDKDNFVTAEKVKNSYLGFGEEYRTLLSVADEFYEQFSKRVGKDRTDGSYEQLLINRKRVESFLRDKYNLSDIPLREIEPQFIQDYYSYLLEERKLAGSTLLTAITKLKQIMLIAQRRGFVRVNPFAGFRFKAQTRDRGYLTEDELQRFMTVELRRYKQRQIRDIFVFQAFTGLAYADVKKLTFDDIQKSFDGEMWLIAKRKKTGTTFYVKLLPVAKKLIEQYRLVAKNKFIFPVSSNAENMNRTLRRIGKQAGITKWISSHMARHTMATTVCLSQGVPIETVSQMLGHSNIHTTQIYAKITNEKISRDMAALTDRIGDKYQVETNRPDSDFRNIGKVGKKKQIHAMKEEITVSGLIELIESGERKNIRLRSWELAKLFGVYESTINANIKAIIRADVVKVCLDCEVRLYGNILIPETCDLEMIVALSFRINTYETAMFRKWIIRKTISKPPNIIVLPIILPG